MSDEPIERALRDWLSDHTEREAPASLRRHLDALAAGGAAAGAGAVPASGRIAVQPVLRGRAGTSNSRRSWARAIAAAVAIALVGGGLLYGLTQRPSPAVSGSPTTGASGTPRGTASPAIRSSTAVVGAALVDPTNGWALTTTDLVWTADGGATWRSIRPTDVAAASIKAVHFVDARMGWLAWWSVANPRVTIERTTDGGRTWSRSHTPGTHLDGIGGVSIEAFDDGALFVQIETVHGSAACTGELDASTDAGISWLPVVQSSDLGSGCAPIRFLDRLHGWTTAGPLRQALVGTSDGGRTWREIQSVNPRGYGRNLPAYQVPAFTEGGRGLDGILLVRLVPPDVNVPGASGHVAIDRTADGGATWQRASGPPDPMLGLGDPQIPVGAAALGANDWLVAGSPSSSRLWHTTDGGVTWSALSPGSLPSTITALGFVDGTTGWAIDDGGGALHATGDSGTTWQTLDPQPKPEPAPTPSPSPAASPETGLTSFTWTLLSSEGDLATYDINHVIARRDGGWIGIANGLQGPRTVHSDDGTTWVLDPADPGLMTAAKDHLNLVDGTSDGPAGLVVVGASALGDISSGVSRAWTSSDGRHWRLADSIGGDPNASIEAVVGGTQGYIAVGSDGFPGGNTQLPGAHGAAAWTSADGNTWKRVPGQAAFAGAIMTGIGVTPRGYVAWGENIPNRTLPDQPLPIWTSADGITWTRTTSRPGDSVWPIGQVVVGRDRLVAVGTRDRSGAAGGGTDAGAWTSTDDGQTWDRARFAVLVPAAGSAPSSHLFAVAMAGADLVAVGNVQDELGDQTSGAVFRSTDDGGTWTQVPDDPLFNGALMRRVLALDENRFVVFGQANDPNALVNPNLIWLATRQP